MLLSPGATASRGRKRWYESVVVLQGEVARQYSEEFERLWINAK
jgi:hypothetical protein